MRFVVLEHDGPRGLHWDLMLESGATLRTWALRELPQAGRPIVAEALGDHRIEYLEYEGSISGGRGEVRRWDQGTYELLEESENGLELRLLGERITGPARLVRRETDWVFVLGGV